MEGGRPCLKQGVHLVTEILGRRGGEEVGGIVGGDDADVQRGRRWGVRDYWAGYGWPWLVDRERERGLFQGWWDEGWEVGCRG